MERRVTVTHECGHVSKLLLCYITTSVNYTHRPVAVQSSVANSCPKVTRLHKQTVHFYKHNQVSSRLECLAIQQGPTTGQVHASFFPSPPHLLHLQTLSSHKDKPICRTMCLPSNCQIVLFAVTGLAAPSSMHCLCLPSERVVRDRSQTIPVVELSLSLSHSES